MAPLLPANYADYLHRLTSPFLVVVQVASSELPSALMVAQAIAAEVAGDEVRARTAADGTRLPTGADVIAPRSIADLSAAWRTLHELHLQAWGGATPSPGKERLRHLADAPTASAAFRFPVSIRGGVPGIRVRQAAPTYETGARVSAVAPEGICLGDYVDGGLATMAYAELNRHALVAGITGSGKTTTCMHLLGELWAHGMFMRGPNYRAAHGLPERMADRQVRDHMAGFSDTGGTRTYRSPVAAFASSSAAIATASRRSSTSREPRSGSRKPFSPSPSPMKLATIRRRGPALSGPAKRRPQGPAAAGEGEALARFTESSE